MKYRLITHSFKEIIDILATMAAQTDPNLENMRVAYIMDDPIVHLDSAFDFIDLDPNESSIKKISLYQLID